MTFAAFSFGLLFLCVLVVRLLPPGKMRWLALAAFNLVFLVYVAGTMAIAAALYLLVVWLLVRSGGEKLPKWRLIVVILLMSVFILRPKIGDALPAAANLPIMLGSSYLAFCLIGLAVDRYRGQVQRVNTLAFWNWATFFPAFTAGPIRRFTPFAAQQATGSEPAPFWWGVTRLLIGVFKRIVLVGSLAPLASLLTESTTSYLELWLGVYAYSLMIYLEFSAYTDIALGAAGMLGLRIEENFNWPYLATNISTFWKRWHMSLTGWLRDYLFIPLGGSRAGRARTALNTVLVMVIIGLWHGLTTHFLVWGLYHAAGLLIYRAYTNLLRGGDRSVKPGRWRRLAAGLLTFHFVTVGWVFFACDLDRAWMVIKIMFTGGF